MNLNLPTSRGRFGRFGHLTPLSGGVQGLGYLGVCNPMPGSAFCQDPNTGNVVSCTDKICVTPAAPAPGAGGEWSSNAPTTNPIYQNIPIGGFTGDFQVETLDSFLAGVLAAKESPFMANVLAKGADTVANQAADFQAQADSYCSINSALPDCGQKTQLVAKYRSLFLSWAAGQPASIYQSGDKGTLAAPVNVLTNTAPVYTAPPTVNPVNVLTTPSTGNPTTGSTNVTAPGTPPAGQQQQTAQPDAVTQWLQQNWVLVAAAVGGLILLPQLMKGGR